MSNRKFTFLDKNLKIEEKKREEAKNELTRYMFYFERFEIGLDKGRGFKIIIDVLSKGDSYRYFYHFLR